MTDDITPKPDPSERAVDALTLGLENLEQLLSQRIGELEVSTSRRFEHAQDLTEARFVTYKALLDGNSDKVALALTATDKALTKQDAFTEKRFDLLAVQINDLRASRDTTAGEGAGKVQNQATLVGVISVVVIVVNVVVALASRLAG